MIRRLFLLFLAIIGFSVSFSGCGYSIRSLAYNKNTTIYVKPFENEIDLNITSEYSDKNPYRLYRPGMETKITNEVINRFLLDGYLKVVSDLSKADLLLSGELTSYEKQPLKYNESTRDVEEYRANIIVNINLEDRKQNKIVYKEDGFVGYSEFALTGPRVKSEDVAIDDAVKDLARRIVERTVEDW